MINQEIAQQLAGQIISYINSRRDKREESYLKDKTKKNKQGVITNGAINERLLSVVKVLSQDKEAIIILSKSKKSKDQTALNFQKDKYHALLSLISADVVNDALHALKIEYQDFIISNNVEHEPVQWLNQWVAKAKDISFATHVGKLTHSSSKSSSILDVTTDGKDSYLTTNSLNKLEVDTASSNAASLPIAEVLKLTVSGTSVIDCLKLEDKSVFKKLTNDTAVVNEWCEQLKQAYDSTEKKSYFLSKQVYFPAGKNQYHLLLPLTSSSLVHELHLQHKKYFDEEQTAARKQKSDKKYSVIETCTYPNKAYLHVTGSNHSNASSLNGKRGGRIALLPTMPPQWQSRLPSYVNKTSIFDKALAFELREEILELRKYLIVLKNKTLSISEPARNATVQSKLQSISSQFFNYVDTINNNETIHDWTIDSKLPIEQQIMFQPLREDNTAKALKINNEWQKILSQSYGRWLSKQLEQKNMLTLKPLQSALWADCFLLELREMVAIQEVAL
jgi:CRISPR-associated protein Csy1